MTDNNTHLWKEQYNNAKQLLSLRFYNISFHELTMQVTTHNLNLLHNHWNRTSHRNVLHILSTGSCHVLLNHTQ